MASSTQTALAKENCSLLYETLKLEAPGDLAKCDKPVRTYQLKKCVAPTSAVSMRAASHVVLALDSSGSMAGRVGGERKIAVAKDATVDFLNALQDDVPVGLVVYGHQGSNKASGKAESCEAVQWLHPLGTDRSQLQDSIDAVKPVGWTPIASTLNFIEAELRKTLNSANPEEKKFTPVVYIVSDGKETCGGDPVAAALSLHEAGAKTAVNIIGFDVNAATRKELQAISKAGGGQYFPAKDARALRKQLQAASKSERSLSEYNGCVANNASRVSLAFLGSRNDLDQCYQRQSYALKSEIIDNKARRWNEANDPKGECYFEITDASAADYQAAQEKLKVLQEKLKGDEQVALDKAHAHSTSPVVDKK